MWYKAILIGLFTIALSACADYRQNESFHGVGQAHCENIKRELHLGSHRHNAGKKLTAADKADLMREYKTYDCDNELVFN